MAVTCDGLVRQSAQCGRPAVTHLEATVRDRKIAMDLCDECSRTVESILTKAGGQVVGANVDYKPRQAYVAKSGATFTAEEARAWLVQQGLASTRGRLSRTQLQTYADAH